MRGISVPWVDGGDTNIDFRELVFQDAGFGKDWWRFTCISRVSKCLRDLAQMIMDDLNLRDRDRKRCLKSGIFYTR